MNRYLLIFLIILAVKRAEKKRDEQQETINANAQTVSMLIIDKKKMRIKDAGLPDVVVSQAPWYSKMSKVPVVKAKVGPRIVTLIADIMIFDDIPLKREVKATVSGIYITDVKGIRNVKQEETKKKGLFAKLRARASKK